MVADKNKDERRWPRGKKPRPPGSRSRELGELERYVMNHKEGMRPLYERPIYQDLVRRCEGLSSEESLKDSPHKPRGAPLSPALAVLESMSKAAQSKISGPRSQGVWSPFGKPFAALGPPDEGRLEKKQTPMLNRHSLSNEGNDAQQSSKGEERSQHPAVDGGEEEPEQEGNRGGEGDEASSESKTPETESYRVPSSRVLRWGSREGIQATFPRVEVLASERRRCQSRGGTEFVVSEDEARQGTVPDEELLACLFPPKTRFEQRSHSRPQAESPSRHESMPQEPFEDEGNRSRHQNQAFPSTSSPPDDANDEPDISKRSSVSRGNKSRASEQREGRRDNPPEPRELIDTQARTAWDSDFLVSRWRLSFLEVRYRNNWELMRKLTERNRKLVQARSSRGTAASVAETLDSDLRRNEGRLNRVPPRPSSIYDRAESRMRAHAKAQQPTMYEGDVLDRIEHFYERLCTLVHDHCAGDELAASIVYRVKSLLEEGVGLTRTLLSAIVSHIAALPKEAEAFRIMPILDFVCHACGCSQSELAIQLHRHRLTSLMPANALQGHDQQQPSTPLDTESSKCTPLGGEESSALSGSRHPGKPAVDYE